MDLDYRAVRNYILQKRALLAVTLAVILCCACVLAQDSRPETGTVIKKSKMDGRGELAIINKDADDAVAVLIENRTGLVAAAVYVRGGDVFNLIGIEDGIYNFYFEQGRSWNSGLQRFDANASQSRMYDPIAFESVKTPEGIRYSVNQITLKKEAGRNTIAVPVGDKDFPELG